MNLYGALIALRRAGVPADRLEQAHADAVKEAVDTGRPVEDVLAEYAARVREQRRNQ